MENSIEFQPGHYISYITPDEAEKKHLLTKPLLQKLHLQALGLPIFYSKDNNGNIIYYYHPNDVGEAPPEVWYKTGKKNETKTLEDGTVIPKLTARKANSFGYYTAQQLDNGFYNVPEKPVAYWEKRDGTILYFYDKKMATRRPLLCVKCGKNIRYRHKLCKECFDLDVKKRCKEGDIYRNQHFHKSRKTTIFFDLELTGVYNHDEILSVSITNGEGTVLMDTLVKPSHKKKWKETEKIHGITPDMVVDAPYLTEITDDIKKIFAYADSIIAYGINTDYSHIKWIYDTAKERDWLHKKAKCAYMEFTRYQSEHYPDLTHSSLSDAMALLGIEWDGVAHTSIADTIGCAKVWEKLFPNYYDD